MDTEFSEFDNNSFRDRMGYVYLYVPKLGYRKRCRLILEKHLNRKLTTDECVHHKNGIKHDDRIENLEILSRAEHSRLHGKKRQGKTPKVTKATERAIHSLRLYSTYNKT